MMRLKSIFCSWDLILAVLVTGFLIYVFKAFIDFEDFKSISMKLTDTGVITFTVLFPLFFAALTIIITASDDDFATFLQKRGYLSAIIASFKYTLILVFIAFLFSITLNVFVEYLFLVVYKQVNYVIITLYFFILLYALLSTFNSIIDAMKYSRYRAEYFARKNNEC